MNKTIEKADSDVISVIDEFDYSTQSDSYNESFIAWRKNKKNPYAYNFTLHKKESVYIDGKGFINESAADAEASVMNKLLSLIGIAVLIVVAIENVFGKILVQILDTVGVDVHNAFFNSVIYGGCREVAMVLIIITSLKLLIPMIIMRTQLKMPLRNSIPLTTKNSLELIAAIAAALIVSVVMGLSYAFSDESTEVYQFFQQYNADMSLWGQEEFVVYSFFDVIVVSVLFEVLFRGAMFTALRQFGDIYAIVITSVVSGLVMQDLNAMLGVMAISVIASIGMLRSGSILTPILVRIVYKMYIFALAIFQMSDEAIMPLERSVFMVGVFCAGILIFMLTLIPGKLREERFFAKYTCHIPRKGQLPVTIKVFIFTASAVLCLLIAVMSAVLHI